MDLNFRPTCEAAGVNRQGSCETLIGPTTPQSAARRLRADIRTQHQRALISRTQRPTHIRRRAAAFSAVQPHAAADAHPQGVQPRSAPCSR
ncbi:MAG: hypothetical protein ACOY0T_32260, partial [Myxococcota bacterium]